MTTTIYLIRHANTFKEHKGKSYTNEPLLIQNEKEPLSILGEKKRQFSFKIKNFKI